MYDSKHPAIIRKNVKRMRYIISITIEHAFFVSLLIYIYIYESKNSIRRHFRLYKEPLFPTPYRRVFE